MASILCSSNFIPQPASKSLKVFNLEIKCSMQSKLVGLKAMNPMPTCTQFKSSWLRHTSLHQRVYQGCHPLNVGKHPLGFDELGFHFVYQTTTQFCPSFIWYINPLKVRLQIFKDGHTNEIHRFHHFCFPSWLSLRHPKAQFVFPKQSSIVPYFSIDLSCGTSIRNNQ